MKQCYIFLTRRLANAQPLKCFAKIFKVSNMLKAVTNSLDRTLCKMLQT